MTFEKIIRGGEVYTGYEVYTADIGIEGGEIVAIEKNLDSPAIREIDARGKQVLPAVIDAHVHYNLELPLLGTTSRDDYRTGAKAAAHGGVTTVIDFGEQEEGGSLLAGINQKINNQIKGLSPIDYSLHATVYHWRPELLEELEELVEAGFPTIKMFMIYSEEGWQAGEPALLEGMKKAAEIGATISVHCENDELLGHFTDKVARDGANEGAYDLARARPNIVEASAVRRAAEICDYVDGRLYVVHLTTRQGATALARARERGVNVFVETCPQFLTLTEEKLKERGGHLYASSPQVKTSRDNEALWRHLEENNIDVVATDNCTFNRKQKNLWDGDFREIPRGLPGTETLFPLLYTYGYRKRNWNLNKVVRKVSTNPARIHGLYPRKGSLNVGSDADLIVVDPDKSIKIEPEKLVTDCDWSPYTGWELFGFPEYTFCRGKSLVAEGKVQEDIEGHGELIPRKPNGRPAY